MFFRRRWRKKEGKENAQKQVDEEFLAPSCSALIPSIDRSSLSEAFVFTFNKVNYQSFIDCRSRDWKKMQMNWLQPGPFE